MTIASTTTRIRPPEASRSARARRSGLSSDARATRSAAGARANSTAIHHPCSPEAPGVADTASSAPIPDAGIPTASPSASRPPRSLAGEAPRAAASSRPPRRRSKTTRAPRTTTAIATPIGPDAIMASTASTAAADATAASRVSRMPLENATWPTVAIAAYGWKEPGGASGSSTSIHCPRPSANEALATSPSCVASSGASSAVTARVSIGIHALISSASACGANAGQDAGSNQATAVYSGGEMPLSTTDARRAVGRCVQNPSSASAARTVPESRTSSAPFGYSATRTSPGLQSSDPAADSASTISIGPSNDCWTGPGSGAGQAPSTSSRWSRMRGSNPGWMRYTGEPGPALGMLAFTGPATATEIGSPVAPRSGSGSRARMSAIRSSCPPQTASTSSGSVVPRVDGPGSGPKRVVVVRSSSDAGCSARRSARACVWTAATARGAATASSAATQTSAASRTDGRGAAATCRSRSPAEPVRDRVSRRPVRAMRSTRVRRPSARRRSR
ncbi:hypothetical protein DSM26151_22630 [Agromyces marinus]|nr:hypothetical protein DSM26151_22630 [Agromyces marinus]